MAAAANTEATLSKRRFSDFQRGKRQKAEKATKMKVEKPKQRGINNSTLYRVCQQVLDIIRENVTLFLLESFSIISISFKLCQFIM